MTIVKRDGRVVDFHQEKIQDAVQKAFVAVDGKLTDPDIKLSIDITSSITGNLNKEMSYTVENIQDLVEDALMTSNRKDVARAYITYRNSRTKERERNSAIRKKIRDKIFAKDVTNQNANVDERSFGGRKGEADAVLLKEMALEEFVSDLSKKNHLGNMIYIHDLDSYILGDHNCLSIPFDDLLKNGFKVRQTDVRPARSINTAFQLVAVLFQIQSLQQFGGVAATHLDWTMVPYVRISLFKHYLMEYLKEIDTFYDMDFVNMSEEEFDNWVSRNKKWYLNNMNLTEDDFYIGSGSLDKTLYQRALFDTRKELYQAVEGMYHNLNTLQSRSGNQLPFSSINYGTCTLPEGRMVTRAILECSIKGVGALHRTSIFPCGIFQYMKGVNDKLGTPNYDLKRLALKSTAKRLYPNYVNVDWSVNSNYDRNDPRTYCSTMGCRTYNGFDINGLGQLKDGRGNIAPVTIILPTLAMMAKEKEGDILENFMDILDTKIHEAKDMLIERFEWICEQDPASARFMYENNTMAGYIPEEGIRSALKHGTLALGQLGLAETLQILIGCDHTTERGMEVAKQIESLFSVRCKEFKEEYKLNIGVYYTPAENLCYTAMTKFKETYGVIEKVSDHDYFTNSMHVPVWDKVSPFEKIDIESQLTGYSNAGCITYIELDGSVIKNIDAVEEIVDYAMSKDIPYFAINVPNDTCLECGYTGEFNDECPACRSSNIQQLRRVTGYLTGDYKSAFNYGKQKETEDRVKHVNIMETMEE